MPARKPKRKTKKKRVAPLSLPNRKHLTTEELCGYMRWVRDSLLRVLVRDHHPEQWPDRPRRPLLPIGIVKARMGWQIRYRDPFGNARLEPAGLPHDTPVDVVRRHLNELREEYDNGEAMKKYRAEEKVWKKERREDLLFIEKIVNIIGSLEDYLARHAGQEGVQHSEAERLLEKAARAVGDVNFVN